jgi:parvulin-like peptidyl-prolyl isomerase
VSEPLRGSAGYHVLRLRDRVAGELAPFEAVAEEVRVEYLRHQGESALRDYLAELRRGADVRILDAELAPE